MKRNAIRSATVAILLVSIGPYYVSRFVIPVAIEPFKGVLIGGAGADVGEKIIKRIFPSVTYANSATTIQPEITVTRSRASQSHLNPDVVFASARMPVFEISSKVAATAGGGVACCQSSSPTDCSFATVTLAQPIASVLSNRMVDQFYSS